MITTILKEVKHNDKEYRIVRKDYYMYHDVIGGDKETDKEPTYICTTISVEVHRKFLFIPFWSIINFEECRAKKYIGLITIATNKWFNKNIING